MTVRIQLRSVHCEQEHMCTSTGRGIVWGCEEQSERRGRGMKGSRFAVEKKRFGGWFVSLMACRAAPMACHVCRRLNLLVLTSHDIPLMDTTCHDQARSGLANPQSNIRCKCIVLVHYAEILWTVSKCTHRNIIRITNKTC